MRDRTRNSDPGSLSDHSSNTQPPGQQQQQQQQQPPFVAYRAKFPSTVSQTSSHGAVSFEDYVHYAAPKSLNIRSIFPPSAVTLGRNAFDRYGDLISDFEIISCNGDRIPVSMRVLIDRWGKYFAHILAKGYVIAVDQFESGVTPTHSNILQNTKRTHQQSQEEHEYGHGHEDRHGDLNVNVNVNAQTPKDAPHFRIPFQTSNENLNIDFAEQRRAKSSTSSASSVSIDPQQLEKQDPSFIAATAAATNTNTNTTTTETTAPIVTAATSNATTTTTSFSSPPVLDSLINTQLKDIPPQKPLPREQLPPVPSAPTSYRMSSPRASLLHTLSVLRNIPASRSPKGSPFASPRASLSAPSGPAPGSNTGSSPLHHDLSSSLPNMRPSFSRSNSDLKLSSTSTASTRGERLSHADISSGDGGNFYRERSDTLDEEGEVSDEEPQFENYAMEPSLIPRKLYIPFTTTTVRAFCEFLYTGQIGNRWQIAPTLLDNFLIGKFYKVSTLYDLVRDTLVNIIGRKEQYYMEINDERISAHLKFIASIDAGEVDYDLMEKVSDVCAAANNFDGANIGNGNRGGGGGSGGSGGSGGGSSNNGDNDDEGSSSDGGSDRSSDGHKGGFGLEYLDAESLAAPKIGPRNRSVFDRPKYDYDEDEDEEAEEGVAKHSKLNTVTVEEAVDPESAVPSDSIIDAIYESCVLVGDMNLFLRCANLKIIKSLLQ